MGKGILWGSIRRLLWPMTLSCGFVTPLMAEDSFDAGKYRITLAGQQRMLTQRMAKAVCFIELGVDTSEYIKVLGESEQMFTSALQELRLGGGEHDLPPETGGRTLDGLDVVETDWIAFSAAVRDVVGSAKVSKESSAVIVGKNTILMENMDKLTSMIEQEYANPNEMMMAAAVAQNLFDRQRMLAQKVSKEFCYVASDQNPGVERENLEESRALFDTSLNALINGMPAVGLKPPPTQDITDQLIAVKTVWAPLDKVFQRVSAGEPPTDDDVAFVAAENTRLLEEMHKAVILYQEH